MHMLASVTPKQIAQAEANQGLKMAIGEISFALTQEIAFKAPKILNLECLPLDRIALKLLVSIIRVFVDSIKVSRKLDPADILLLADDLLKKHSMESIEDFILAMKEARSARFYDKLDVSEIQRVVDAYFDRKISWRENMILDEKSRSTSINHNAIDLINHVAPRIMQSVASMLDPTHPNAESHRFQLNLLKKREKVGTLSAEQARIQRANIASHQMRKSRPDWGRRTT